MARTPVTMKRLLFWLTVLAIGAGLTYAAYRFSRPPGPETVAVERRTIELLLEARGRTSLSRRFVLTAPFSGLFEPATLREGDTVTPDTELGKVEGERLRLELERAMAEVRRVEAAIREASDTAAEEVLISQAEEVVRSLDHTVEAAQAQTESARSQFTYQREYLQRIQQLYERQAVSEDELHRAQVDATNAQVDLRQAQVLELALRSLREATALVPTTIRRLLDRRRLRVAVLQEELAAAQKQLELAELNYKRSAIRTPVGGVLLKFPVKNPQTVAAGQTIAVIGRFADLEARVDVLTSDAVKLGRGTEVRLAWRAGELPFGKATVDRVDPTAFTKVSALGVEQQRVWVHLRLDDETLERLRSLPSPLPVDFEVWATFVLDRHERALVVPRSATYRDADGRWYVQVVREDQVLPHPIRVGIVTDRDVEVVEGLQEGDEVLLVPRS